MQAVVLAGGLATRMRPHTLTVPKSMLAVAGKPFIDWQLERLVACDLRDVVLCVAHLGDVIRAHVGDGRRFGARVEYSQEGPDLLGTAGALRVALPLLEESFLVTYGDSYLPFDYAEPLRILAASGDDCDGVMAVFKNEGKWDKSNVALDAGRARDARQPDAASGAARGAWVLRYDKTREPDPALDHIDYGATALRRALIASLPPGKALGLDALQKSLAASKRLRACVARERFFEIGSPEGLADLDQHLRGRASS